MDANPGIDGGGGGTVHIYLGGLGVCCRNILRFSCHERASGAIWGSNARLETIKWLFLD